MRQTSSSLMVSILRAGSQHRRCPVFQDMAEFAGMNQGSVRMSESMLVRASRDGDQFHYLWAARRALQLLTPQSGLVAIAIEGAATDELSEAEVSEVGEQLIDIAEYYGSTELRSATRVRYLQLKHSTVRVDEIWQPSGLEKTICGFAERYQALQKELPDTPLSEILEFWFVTNRPISADFIEAVEDAASQRKARHPNNLKKLEKFTSLNGDALATFCRMLHLEGLQDDYWTQRNILFRDVLGYLPDVDVDAPVRLKELVNKKALSESATNPTITKMDVLRELRTDEGQLFPAPCLIGKIADAIPRQQELGIIRSVIDARDHPVIVHADAGVGKSVLSTRIGQNLPEGSVSLLYDCFGNGQYRSVTGYRHRHRIALVQLANELSALGLCHPLIPSPNADSTAYMRAFLYRVKQAVTLLKAQNADALLCLIVDAADNAQMAAEDIGEPRSFVRDLLREALPEGVRLVALCRPHREAMLDPPPHALLLGLNAFILDETAAHLRQSFPLATDQDVEEFHRLSSQNPRVQALALSRGLPLPDMLRLLGPNPTTVDSALEGILEQSIAKLRDTAGALERSQIDLICAALASLRPLVPIAVLAGISGVTPALVRSFALDLGRPLIVNDETVQFYDEPAETWFRERFKPEASRLGDFVERLASLSFSSAYVASVLPQLMLEAGQLSELVDLALTSEGLPGSGPVERRDIELQRLQFALKASLRSHRYPEAAKLALKAGGESAGNERQRTLLRENADLVSPFMDSNSAQEIVSRRTFGSGWVGSHHLYEAVVLSGYPELKGEARSRLRMAEEWLINWSELPAEDRQQEPVTDTDRAMMTIAFLRIDGPGPAAESLRRWHPRSLSYEAGCIAAKRLLDHGRYDELDALALAAGNDLALILGLAEQACNLNRALPTEVTRRALRLLSRVRFIDAPDKWDGSPPLVAISSIVEAAFRQNICDSEKAIRVLSRFLPFPPSTRMSSHFGVSPNLRTYALQAALAGSKLDVTDVASPGIKEEMQNSKSHSKSQELREFESSVGVLIPWVNLWAQSVVSTPSQSSLQEAISQAVSSTASTATYNRQDFPHITDAIAVLWMDTLLVSQVTERGSYNDLIEWANNLSRPLFTPTLNRLTRLFSSVRGSEDFAFTLANTAASLHRSERSDARHLVEGLVDVARSLLAISPEDAQVYFDEAVGVASRIGDENLARWDAVIELADRASSEARPAPEVAYNFARCAEVTRDYVDRDKHFAWTATIDALVGLCPTSALTIASRWRDRHFGSDDRILKGTIRALLAKKAINALDALAMIGFRADWDEPGLVAAALESCAEPHIRETALRLTYRYMTLKTQTAAQWQALTFLANSASVSLPGLSLSLAGAIKLEAIQKKRSPSHPPLQASPSSAKRDWDAIFRDCDLSMAMGILISHQRFKEDTPPFNTEEFFSEITRRVQVGKEPSFITAFADSTQFDLWHLRYFLEALPAHWIARPAIRNALQSMLKVITRRHCMVIRRSRHYEVMPFQLAYQSSGIGKDELLDTILEAIAESAEQVGADHLFSLVGLLAEKLTQDEALKTLSYGLMLFEPVLEERDGDGEWTQDLTPPATVEEALAGYVWAALASPIAATRWEAAHTVVALCALDRTRVVDELFAHALSDVTSPYGDARFEFYSLHAHQWLLIAAARAALEYPKALIPHIDYLLAKADLHPRHLMIQLFAARTLMVLTYHGVTAISVEVQQGLVNICSTLGVRPEDASPSVTPPMSASKDTIEGDRSSFDWDVEQYWLKPLGRCFGLRPAQVAHEADSMRRDELGYTGTHRWDEDARNQAELFRYEDTTCRHGSYPRVDNLSFYYSYHAMMMTASQLLSTVAQVNREDSNDDRFGEWLTRHDLARPNGRWIADRRDPIPLSYYDRPGCDEVGDWLGSISINDFDHALYPGSGLMTLWGSWSGINPNHIETISVHSALVSPSTSSSLLRALQTVEHPHDFRIPSAEDELEIDTPPYLLIGWVKHSHDESGIDSSDPWGGNIPFPVPEPAAFVIEVMSLTTDPDRREWFLPSSSTPVMTSRTWGDSDVDDSAETANGHRLEASIDFVIEYLQAVGKHLVVEVEIQQNTRHQNYRVRDDDELTHLPPSNRIYIFRNDGSVQSLHGHHDLRETVGNRTGL